MTGRKFGHAAVTIALLAFGLAGAGLTFAVLMLPTRVPMIGGMQ